MSKHLLVALLALTVVPLAYVQYPRTIVFQTPAAQLPTGEFACGPANEKFTTQTDKNSHPEPLPSADKALVYVVRPTMFGQKIQTKFGVDGKWVGVNRGNNYFFIFLDPGSHHFCSQADNKATADLTLEAGKVYFVQQHVQAGGMKAANSLELLDDERGRAALKKCHLSISEHKAD